MYRLLLAILVAGIAAESSFAGQGGSRNALSDAAELYEKALQEVIKQAEPSIVSVLVSRSEVYKKTFHDEPPADDPGKLGGFDTSKADLPVRPPRPEGRRRFGRGNMQNPQNELDVYDLSKPGTVPESYGSGVVIDGEKLLILTAYHVVRDATKIYVRLPSGGGEEARGSYADIHAADPRSDLAVLRLIDASVGPLKTIKFGDAGTLRKGSLIVSLANLYGPSNSTASPSAANGIVSNLSRSEAKQQTGLASPRESDEFLIQRPLYMAGTLIQTNAALNSGCSGGALLNLKGEMVGLTTARAAMSGSDKSGGFAMPVDKALLRIIARLRAGEEVQYGFLGVRSAWDGVAGRVKITNIEPGSPAHEAGLLGNHTIVSINGEKVNSVEDVNLKISTLLAGSTAEIEVGELGTRSSRSVSVTLAKTYTPGKIIASSRPTPVRGMRVDYATVLAVQRNENQFRPFPPRMQTGYNGVYVRELQAGSKAAALLHVNDIITHVRTGDGLAPVNTPAEFYRLAAKIPPGQPLELSLQNSEPVTIP